MNTQDLALDLLAMALTRRNEPHALAATLIALDGLAQKRPEHALTHYASGRVLMMLGNHQLALGALRMASERAPDLFEAHYYEGVCQWLLGFEALALEKFEAALAVDDTRFEPYYDAGQIFANRAEHLRALRTFALALERAPDDFGVLKKVLQGQIRLELWDAARDTHARLRALWSTSRDPAIRAIRSYVLDQFEVGDHVVLCLETFEPTGDPQILMSFNVTHEGRLAFTINLESSAALRALGFAWILVVQEGDVRLNTGTTFDARPPYRSLREEVVSLVTRWATSEETA